MDENFVAKLVDVGSEVAFDEGHVLVEPGIPVNGVFLVLQGLLAIHGPDGEDERGPGQVVGEWEKLDGSEDVRVTALTEVRLIAVDRASYEAALTG
jgi:CRP-like cAMP-binding protein